MSSDQVKIYIRNSKKYGKILNTPTSILSEDLYRLAAAAHNLPVEDVTLIIAGQPLPAEGTEVALKEKAIVHLINLREVNVEAIEVSVRPLHGRTGTVKIETNTDVTIRDFIDDKLHKVYGEKSDVLLLVHIGRQLNLGRTFREELIENGSELIVANIQELKNRKSTDSAREVEATEQIAVPIKDLEVPEQPKDIYPQPNFTIAVPQQVNANMSMDLIFDSKIRHASSLQRCDLEPEEIIPEEEIVAKISEEAQQDDTDREGQKQEGEEVPKEVEEQREEVDQVVDVEPVISAQVIEPTESKTYSAAQEYSIEAAELAEEEGVSGQVANEGVRENRNFTDEGVEEVSSELRRPEDVAEQF